jgi:hypothetical protein
VREARGIGGASRVHFPPFAYTRNMRGPKRTPEVS